MILEERIINQGNILNRKKTINKPILKGNLSSNSKNIIDFEEKNVCGFVENDEK